MSTASRCPQTREPPAASLPSTASRNPRARLTWKEHLVVPRGGQGPPTRTRRRLPAPAELRISSLLLTHSLGWTLCFLLGRKEPLPGTQPKLSPGFLSLRRTVPGRRLVWQPAHPLKLKIPQEGSSAAAEFKAASLSPLWLEQGRARRKVSAAVAPPGRAAAHRPLLPRPVFNGVRSGLPAVLGRRGPGNTDVCLKRRGGARGAAGGGTGLADVGLSPALAGGAVRGAKAGGRHVGGFRFP